MTNPSPILTLRLSPKGRDKRHLRLSFAGLLSGEMTVERRRRLLGLLSLWTQPEPLRVAIFADAWGSWEWAEEWTDALKDVASGFELSFVAHEVRRG